MDDQISEILMKIDFKISPFPELDANSDDFIVNYCSNKKKLYQNF